MKRDLKGKFVYQWHTEPKHGVSLSLTKTAWQMLEAEARQQGISKSELVERFARSLQADSEEMSVLEPLVLQQAYRELEQRSEQLRVELERAQACLQAQARDRQQAEAERVVYLQEMTHCQQTENILHETEERLYLALDAARITVWDFDCRKNRVLCSENALEIWGIRAGKAEVFSCLIHPDDYERVQEIRARALTGEVPYKLEYRVLSPDGYLRWIASQGKVHYDADGEPVRVVGMSVDITDLKHTEQALRESEDRFRAMFDQAAVGINQVSLDGQFMLVNPAFCALTGYSADELINMTFQEITHPEDLAIDLGHSQRVLTKEINGYVLEKRYIRKDGSVIWVNLASSAVWDAEGNPKYAVGVIEDISERKRAEVERQQVEAERHRLLERERTARQAAESANRIKDEFLAVLSHELRSPLNPILGWAKLLRTRKFDQAATDKALETIERNAKLQAQLVEDLLDVSRILQGKLLLNVSPVNLATTIVAALETVRLAAQAKGIQLHTEIDSMAGLVSGDSNRLQQVIWNLLSNAVKFTPSGGSVVVKLERLGNMAQVQVKDTGKGINPIFLPHIFEYFRQEDGTTTRQFGGLGLGLAIARHLVELHGGTVQAESLGEGQGATFTVKLPLMNASVETTQVHPLAANNAELYGLKALVVDDEADMRELVAVILSQAGAEVSVAASATTALSTLDQFQPDVLICDIGMPEVDGYVLLRQVRQRPFTQSGQIPAIALTAYASQAHQQEAIAAGFQLHLAKPIEPAELIGAITSLLKVVPSPA